LTIDGLNINAAAAAQELLDLAAIIQDALLANIATVFGF